MYCVIVVYRWTKLTKVPILGIQRRSRSWMLVPTESSSAVLVVISSKSVCICNHSRARLVDSSRTRTFHGGTQIWCTRTDSLNLGGQTLHRWNLRLMLNIWYAGCLYITWAWFGTGLWQTDGQTDRIPIANTRSQQYLPVQLSRVKWKILIRPPGTVVPGGLLFYSWCFFFTARSPSSVGRSPRNFATWSEVSSIL